MSFLGTLATRLHGPARMAAARRRLRRPVAAAGLALTCVCCSGNTRSCSGLAGSGAVATSTPSATSGAAPSATASAAPAKRSLIDDTGEGEDRSGQAAPELWIPGVEVWAFGFHGRSLFWGNETGIHERPLDGEARAVLEGRKVSLLAADADGVFFIEDRGREGFDLSVLRPGKAAPQRLAHGDCNPQEVALTKAEVFVGSLCEGVFAVAKQGGQRRSIASVGESGEHVATAGEAFCYVSESRILCPGPAGSKGAPREIAVPAPGPLALDGHTLFWQEDAPGSDVIVGGDYGRIVRWDFEKGQRQVLATRQFQAFELTQDERAIYFFSNRGGLRRVKKDGSAIQTLYRLERWESPAFISGGGYAFWSRRTRKDGIHRLRLPDD